MRQEFEIIKSVGIDLGTTTTQVVCSSLKISRRFGLPGADTNQILDREVIYQGLIHFTPLMPDGRLDTAAVRTIIKDEYRRAGLTTGEIASGAIIVTGETAKSANAREDVTALALECGDFVVASAGPHFESILAGLGAGADRYSAGHLKRQLNIDIGGGTANFAVFDCGRLEQTACLNVGGRLFEVDGRGVLKRMHPPGRVILEQVMGSGRPLAGNLGYSQYEMLTGEMVRLMVECILGRPSSLAEALLLTDPLNPETPIDCISLSGGVGACYHHPEIWHPDPFCFGDIGPLLAEAIRRHPYFQEKTIVAPMHAIRATAIGAGANTLSLSGSTIWVRRARLPLRNIPVVKPDLDWERNRPPLKDAVDAALGRLDLTPRASSFAVYLPQQMPVSYASVTRAADELALVFEQSAHGSHPAVIICYHDIGKALGMELDIRMPEAEWVVIDEVNLSNGDYVDIGKNLFDGRMLPLTIKYLAFPAPSDMR